MLIFSLVLGILICFGIPIGGAIIIRKRKNGIWKAFFFGVLAFTISQFCIRLPILTYILPQYAWFTVLQMNPLLYGLFMAGTAGVFEEGARWIAMRFLKERTIYDGLAFGLGHGGVEAIGIVGINLVVMLCMTFAGQGALLSVTSGGIFTAGLERFFTIMFHVGASLIVMYGLRIGKSGRYLLAAIVLHTLSDMGASFPRIWGAGIMAVEMYAAVIAAGVLAIGLYCYFGGSRHPSARSQNYS